MRTSLELPDSLFARLKARAAIEGVPGVLAHGLEAEGRAHSAIIAVAGSTQPRVMLPYLADASEAERALARGA